MNRITLLRLSVLAAAPVPALAAEGPALAGIPVDFMLFALTLLGVALFHHHTLRVALTGLAAIVLYSWCLPVSRPVPGWRVLLRIPATSG